MFRSARARKLERDQDDYLHSQFPASRTPVRSLTFRSPGSALLLVAALSACSSATGAPHTTPVTPVAAAPGGAPVLLNRTFRYAPGVYRYRVQSDGLIELASDTATHSVPIRTTTFYTLTLSPNADGLLHMAGVADSFSVSRDEQIPAPQQDSTTPAGPISFAATMTATGHIQDFHGPAATGCDSAIDVFASAARDLIVPVPFTLRDSTEWTDSATTTTCRGGMPVTNVARYQYRVTGTAIYNDTPAIQVLRTSSNTLTGAGHPPNRTDGTFSLTGNGTASTTFYLEPASGLLLGGTGDGQADITITTSQGQLPFHQEVHLQMTLRR